MAAKVTILLTGEIKGFPNRETSGIIGTREVTRWRGAIKGRGETWGGIGCGARPGGTRRGEVGTLGGAARPWVGGGRARTRFPNSLKE